MIRVVELFAGVGGFRVGLEACSPRFKTVWANQWEPNQKGQWAYKCYKSHFKETICVNKDIAAAIDEVPEHDLLVGGFPCQDYSVAHTGAKGIEGKKGVLWWSINDVVKFQHPKYIVLENVDRLLKSPTNQRGRDFAIMLRCLLDEGYAVEWRVINAADYGNAQRRRRTFIFASLRGTKIYEKLKKRKNNNNDFSQWLLSDGFFAMPFPAISVENAKHSFSDISSSVYNDLISVSDGFAAPFYNSGVMFDGKIYSEELNPVKSDPITLSQIMSEEKVNQKYFVTEDKKKKWEILKGSKRIERTSKVTGYKYIFSEGSIAFPDPLDKPARTMLTSEGAVNRSSHVVKDKRTGRLRVLMPEECEKINGFPVGWTNTGMPERQRYFVMGNALVTHLIEKIGQRLLEII